ncbi:MAG: glycoside hydrolase family 43 protein [Dysgonamonadaceae bacterium]|jgi:alpha-N-arabinofuranosidase|nr:glycoside hydrolase family 43 protein [Dysgonamonadaceae bacterium]
MKNIFYSISITIFGLFALSQVSCQSPKSNQNKTADFLFFEYKGIDAFYDQVIDKENQYFNPVLSGFYPDPSICKKGDDFYLVTSSFVYYPGIPIFHSKDLVNWIQIGHVLDRPSQLKLEDGIRTSGGIYAPAIRYNKYDNTFYLITTCVDGIGNFIVKTKDPKEGWSEPIVIPNVYGIDPSIFFDDNGKTYIVRNDAPVGEPEWDGHRAIWLFEYDLNKNEIIGEQKIIVDGGVDKSLKPVWIEAPHIYKINNWYYLMCAEGGTAENHSEVIFRSKNIWGDYIPYKNNPILTQRDLPEDRENKVTSAGHADIIEDNDGNWWAVFLACRPYEKNFYNTGRETFLLPVTWKNEFPVILPQGEPIPLIVNKENLQNNGKVTLSGNFSWRDNFKCPKLNLRWNFIRTPQEQFYCTKNGKLELKLRDKSIKDKTNPSFIGVRQQHLNFEAETSLDFSPQKDGELAGLVCFQNERHHYVLAKTLKDDQQLIILEKVNAGISEIIAEIPVSKENEDKSVNLKVRGEGGSLLFSFCYSGDDFENLLPAVDATILSTATAGEFSGVYIGLYAYR